MRIIIDSLIAVMLVGVLVVVVTLNNDRKQDQADLTVVQDALKRLHKQAEYRKTLESAEANRDTLLVHMQQAWFGEDTPVNVIVGNGHPWIDLAPPGDFGEHPPDPIATQSTQAGFWYNPTTGVFRARVVPQASEAETVALYNRVNGTSLEAFEQMPDPSRKPVAHVPGKAPAMQYASMANKTWAKPEPGAEKDEPLLDDLPDKPSLGADNKSVNEPQDGVAQRSDAQGEPAIEVLDDDPQDSGSAPSGRPTLKK